MRNRTKQTSWTDQIKSERRFNSKSLITDAGSCMRCVTIKNNVVKHTPQSLAKLRRAGSCERVEKEAATFRSLCCAIYKYRKCLFIVFRTIYRATWSCPAMLGSIACRISWSARASRMGSCSTSCASVRPVSASPPWWTRCSTRTSNRNRVRTRCQLLNWKRTHTNCRKAWFGWRWVKWTSS